MVWLSWLEERIEALPDKSYIMLDCPGQVELYTSNDAVRWGPFCIIYL
jgi:hypothetical protein